MQTFELGEVYRRPDGNYCVTWLWDRGQSSAESSACCNSGHETPQEARQHGEDKRATLRKHTTILTFSRKSIYLKVNGRTWGIEAEWCRHPFSGELRLLSPTRMVKVVT